jgi:NTP pyrophosphatase (non-canonical NTP hydrolase)
MNKTTEILQITQEECAEVIKSIAKCFRFGVDNHYPLSDKNNREHLTEEIGDLLCMIDLIKEHNIVDSVKVEEYKNQKRIKLSKWSNIMEVI